MSDAEKESAQILEDAKRMAEHLRSEAKRVIENEINEARHTLQNEIIASVKTAVVQQVQPLENWGVLPYFNFRSQSEQAKLDQPILA